MYILHLGNCLHELRNIPENSIDSVVCDPPYELGFMGKSWDASGIAYSVAMWREVLRVLKPGGHLLAFSGSRTYHRMTCAVEDAGFEIRDSMMWVYSQGFPKSLDVSKAIDKAAGAERKVVGERKKLQSYGQGVNEVCGDGPDKGGVQLLTAPATQAAKQWRGFGTALKPAHEPICVARKPLDKGLTVAANVLEHGTGALNIDGCRVETGEVHDADRVRNSMGFHGGDNSSVRHAGSGTSNALGRWPANLIHDGSDEVVALFPSQAGAAAPVKGTEPSIASVGNVTGRRERVPGEFHGDTGSAARFFYCAKTSKKDRNEGCEALPQKTGGMVSNTSGQHITRRDEGYEPKPQGNNHPTVKPTDLMRYLCRLVTPPGGTVLDPFMGSGSTGKAAVLEGFRFVGIEMDESYHTIAKARIEAACVSLFADMI